MKMELEITTTLKVKLNTLEVGDWFYGYEDSGEPTLMIKGDDTVYDGAKVVCMKVKNGILARVNFDTEVRPISKVKIQLNIKK